ncbi:MAG TPA: polysaccharide deacetylase family protein [Verrucomicrobiae bacterium]|jgi:peptidoglycan/xylan/chitin deacetylase (PgdA/CDA1 family)|nr:polysaccharide deacetylase family protein [Verrucomicrobiae bacterium]
MKRTLSRLVARGLYPSLKRRAVQSPEVRILCYHAITAEKADYMNVSPENFRDQMKALAEEGYRTVPLDYFFGSGGKVERPIVITFDDGYRDNCTDAWPIMKEFGMTGTIFCVSGKIGGDKYLDRQQIREMAAAGFQFGSHTVTHPRLHQTPKEQKKEELSASKEALQAILGKKVDYFCYPYGQYDQDCLELLKECGYRGACSNAPGANEPGRIANPYLLKRTEIGGFDTLEDFKMKVAGAFDALHVLLHRMRGRP